MVEGNQRPPTKGWQESYEPIVPMKVGNWRSRDPLEGRGEQTNESDAGNMTILRNRETMSTKYIRITELAQEDKERKYRSFLVI